MYEDSEMRRTRKQEIHKYDFRSDFFFFIRVLDADDKFKRKCSSRKITAYAKIYKNTKLQSMKVHHCNNKNIQNEREREYEKSTLHFVICKCKSIAVCVRVK